MRRMPNFCSISVKLAKSVLKLLSDLDIKHPSGVEHGVELTSAMSLLIVFFKMRN